MVCRRKTEGESSQLAHVSRILTLHWQPWPLEVSESPWGIIYDSERLGGSQADGKSKEELACLISSCSSPHPAWPGRGVTLGKEYLQASHSSGFLI